jgi:hypothetical protein
MRKTSVDGPAAHLNELFGTLLQQLARDPLLSYKTHFGISWYVICPLRSE